MRSTPDILRRGKPTWLVYALFSYHVLMISMLGPALPFLRQEQGLSATLSSLHASALALGMLLASLVSPQIIARLGRQRTLWLGGIGVTLASVLFTVSTHPVSTLLSAGMMGALGMLLPIVIAALLADRHPTHRAQVLSEANAGASSGAALAPLLIGLCSVLAIGWRPAMLVGAASFGLLALGLARLHPKELAGVPTQEALLPTAVRSLPRRYWGYWIVLVLVVAVEFALIFWVASFLAVVRGWDAAGAVIASTTFPVLMGLGRLGGAIVTRRFAPVPVLYVSLGLTLGGVLLVWVSPLALTTLVGLALAGAGVANLYPLTLDQALAAAPGQTDRASARAAVASGSAILTAPLLLGALADWFGLARAFGIIPVLALLAMALLAHGVSRPALARPAPQPGDRLLEA